MKRYIRCDSGYPYPYKQSPEYKRLMELGYILEVNKRPEAKGGGELGLAFNKYKDACIIKFPDGDPYAVFTFMEPTDPELLDDFSIEHGMNHWDVYDDGERINDYIDYEPNSFDECVVCALRYFLTYY